MGSGSMHHGSSGGGGGGGGGGNNWNNRGNLDMPNLQSLGINPNGQNGPPNQGLNAHNFHPFIGKQQQNVNVQIFSSF